MKIAIWGTGFFGRLLKRYFAPKHEIVCFFDNYPCDESVDSVKVYKFNASTVLNFDVLYISNMDEKNVRDIERQLRNIDKKIVYLYKDKDLQNEVFVISKYTQLKQFDWNNVILHIVANDKFTDTYIDFMQKNLTEYNHMFFVNRISDRPEIKKKNVFEVINMSELLGNNLVLSLLEHVNKIIISGAFDCNMIINYPKGLYKKTFVQFWGGDFYSFRNDPYRKNMLSQYSNVIDSCAGVLNLISEDSSAIKNILGLKNTKFYEVPMPSTDNYFDKLKKYQKKSKEIVITIGNSATKENNHVEIFEAIKYIKGNMKFCVPLSYGDSIYRSYIIEIGGKILGNRFFPIVDFLPFDQYMQYLADCDVGIFDNDRQQALGNIIALLYMEKKVYIRQDTPMADFFKRIGVKTFNVDTIKNSNMKDILYLSEEEKVRNVENIQKYYSCDNIAKKWRSVLNLKVF